MRFPNKETVERVRKAYPVGCRVELVQMEDMQAPPIGTKGTVRGVDDTASIMVRWDNGSGLNVVYGIDICRKLDAVWSLSEWTMNRLPRSEQRVRSEVWMTQPPSWLDGIQAPD